MIDNYLNVEKMPAVQRVLVAAQEQIKKIIGVNIALTVKCIRSESPDENKALLQKLVIKYSGIDWDKITSKTREKEVVDARFAYMYHANKFLNQSLTKTAADLDMKHHTSVLHGIKTVKDLLTVHDPIEKLIKSIEKELPYDIEIN